MKTMVITGATSFIGIHILQECIKRGYMIHAIVRPNSPNLLRIPKDGNVNVTELEMRNYKKLPELVKKADIFIHLAWEGTRVPYRDDEEIQYNNYKCSIAVMEAAICMNCKVFVGVGSQAEYGDMEENITEESQCRPITEYGKKKLMSYNMLKKMADQNKVRFIWTRIFSVYGRYDCSTTLVMSALKKMKNNQPIELTACTNWWDFLYVTDAARAIVMLVEKENIFGIYNIASGNQRLLKEFIMEIKEIMNSKSELIFGVISYGPTGPINLKPDISKLSKTILWKPEVSFREGILKILEL